MEQLVSQLGLMINHTGADVRVQTGQVMGKKGAAHGSVRAWWWQWKHLVAVRWHEDYQPSRNENGSANFVVEGQGPSKVGKRWLHLEDSMVSLLILSKGRTSSRLLQPVCKRIGALQLALSITVAHGHVPSEENPTDEASRW